MIKKGSNFFEKNVEKMVLVLVALVCFWLLLTRIFLSPNVVEYDKKKMGTDKIDGYILKDSQRLEAKLKDRAVPKPPYKPQSPAYKKLIDSAVNVNTNLYLPIPFPGKEVVEAKLYNLPDIGTVTDVAVEHIRTVAYYPTEDVNQERTYYTVQHGPNDLDLVTVQARFDVNALYKRFHESFAGENLKEQWRDANLAKPVFAALQLQRQEMLSDDSWSDWQNIPRIRIDSQKEAFGIPEKVDKLPTGGIKLLVFNFSKFQKEILQPMCYEIASANEKWYPPLLHKKLFEKFKNLMGQKLLEQKTARETLLEKQRREGRARRAETTVETRTAGPGVGSGRFGTGSGRSAPAVEEVRPARPERKPEVVPTVPAEANISSEEVFAEVDREIAPEFEKIIIKPDTKLSDLNEPAVIWAYDDTVEPGKNYRYRIRIGAFNPVAGTNNVSEKDESRKNDVILWSEFSQNTDVAAIPGKVYFFPYEIKEVSQSVTIQVSRYAMGQWYSKNFSVQPGETIGKVADGNYTVTMADGSTIPSKVDFSTGAIMIDAVPVNNWVISRNMTPNLYYDVLYSRDNININRIACNQSLWPKDLLDRYYEIKKSQSEPPPPLRLWSPGSFQDTTPSRPIDRGTGRFNREDAGATGPAGRRM